MSVNNCNCKRVLVMPKISDSAKALIFVRTTGGGNVDLSNYYNKQETDEMLAKKLSTNELDNAIDQALLKAKESGEFKGEQGIQGERGEKGEQGEQGERGERGLQGEQGIQGIQGEKGADGAKGEKGDKGDKGDRGEQGIQGEKGADGRTPEKGTDYFTDVDKQEFITELTPTIENLINQAIGEIENGTY